MILLYLYTRCLHIYKMRMHIQDVYTYTRSQYKQEACAYIRYLYIDKTLIYTKMMEHVNRIDGSYPELSCLC